MSEQDSVGRRIQLLRRAQKLTQDALAASCGVSRSAVAQWETDRAGQLRENITRIADALGTSAEYLLHGQANAAGDELALIRLYRACDAEDRAFLLRTAHKLARQAGKAATKAEA
jgi:transcriptional regulator with XRE-family HTH domain